VYLFGYALILWNIVWNCILYFIVSVSMVGEVVSSRLLCSLWFHAPRSSQHIIRDYYSTWYNVLTYVRTRSDILLSPIWICTLYKAMLLLSIYKTFSVFVSLYNVHTNIDFFVFTRSSVKSIVDWEVLKKRNNTTFILRSKIIVR
jgi:hypothetical protein